jgi:hypothetical protein
VHILKNQQQTASQNRFKKKGESDFPAYETALLSLTFLLNWLMSNLG